MKLTSKIREKRMEAHLTQSDLAKAIGKDASHISRFETGRHIPQLITLFQIAKACNCKIDDLYEFDDSN